MKHVKKFENMKSGVYDIYGKYLKSKFSGCFEVTKEFLEPEIKILKFNL